ncbi:MAG: hypothetical protein EAX96_19125 [Candidatus Lokiarchaeota archaeon]|nr:hypothetical protein [Candidatus Lokiarchaeota archaeon]
MNKHDILQKVKEISSLYNLGRVQKSEEKLEKALIEALNLRKIIDKIDQNLKEDFDQMYSNGFYHLDYGLHSQIYNCLNLLGKYDEMLPYLEKSITYLDNNRNPEMWRMLGLLYLAQKNDLEKACNAWKKAIELNPLLLEKYSGLSIVNVYEAMKKQGKKITHVVESLDLKTGEFTIVINKE